MTFGNRLKQLRIQKGYRLEDLADSLGTTKSTLSRYENGLREPKNEFVKRCAELFDVSVDYLSGNEGSVPSETLNKKDERDIEKALSFTLDQLENVQDGLMFDGEILDDETRELLIGSLERAMRLAKKIAKDKYTPNKYKKDK